MARGVALLYRRNKGNGAWVVKCSGAHGAYWTKAFALADDVEDSNGEAVLTFFEAQDVAKKLARGGDDASATAPVSVDGTLKAYGADLEARGANSQRPPSALVSDARAARQAGATAHRAGAARVARRSARHHGEIEA